MITNYPRGAFIALHTVFFKEILVRQIPKAAASIKCHPEEDPDQKLFE